MTEKQYKLEKWTSSSLYYSFPDGNLHHSIGEVIARVENDLNSLYNENEQLKSKNKGLKSELQIFKEDVTHSNQIINKLNDENKQLKKQMVMIDKLIDDLGNVRSWRVND